MAPRAATGAIPPSVEKSPFFAPKKKLTKNTPDEAEHKSSIPGCAANLINAIVGAGIVGIPFAMKSMGLVSGVIMLIVAAALTEKSLRLLIETAKHIDVPSYETLSEATFGRKGFIFVSASMFIIAYGAMVSYLIIIKDLLSVLIGLDPEGDVLKKQLVLIASSAVVVLPLSTQRDMADLAKTSRISVAFDCAMVLLLAIFTPISTSVSNAGGLGTVLQSSVIRPSTFFQGLGVVSFAFVCQHSAFIIATSLRTPTRTRWSKVTASALSICAILAMVCGVSGYLAFMDDTSGNILNNFSGGVSGEEGTSTTQQYAAFIARALICTTMFFVYPMECFVARHVCVVLLFSGRQAHEGDDHAVLARTDRRIILTLLLYIATLIPALLVEDLGIVMALTGSVGGSALSYIGPGVIYIAVHGAHFLDMVQRRFDVSSSSFGKKCCDTILYYILFMPLWCSIASTGDKYLVKHEEEEALKSPHPNRLGKVIHHHPITHHHQTAAAAANRINDMEDEEESDDMLESGIQPLVRQNSYTYGSVPTKNLSKNTPMNIPKKSIQSHGGNHAIALAIVNANKNKKTEKKVEDNSNGEEVVEDDPQDDPPTVYDFVIAVGFVIFGLVACSAGIFSIFT